MKGHISARLRAMIDARNDFERIAAAIRGARITHSERLQLDQLLDTATEPST